MKFIKPSAVRGVVLAPPSKSAMQRTLFAASLCAEETTIRNPSLSADALAARSVIEALGATVKVSSEMAGNHRREVWFVRGGGTPRTNKINCGEAGVTFRVALSLCARFSQEFELTGEGSLLRRPLPDIEASLASLGVSYRTASSSEFPPVFVRGPMRGGHVRVDGSLTSQFISGLLFALPVCLGESELEVNNLVSLPYIKMTLETLATFGIKIGHSSDYSRFMVPGSQRYQPQSLQIEGDWSGASVWLALAAIRGELGVEGLFEDSQQADVAMLSAVRRSGAIVSRHGSTLHVSPDISQGPPKAFEFDATDCPDLFPALVVLAAGCHGRSVIRGARRLLAKESNRAQVLVQEGRKIGLEISWSDDQIEVIGGELVGGTIDAHDDHRIAMAFTALGCLSQQGVTIQGSECVSKSYPEFFEDLAKLAAEE